MSETFDLASNSLGTSSSTNGLNGTLTINDKTGAGPLLLKILVPAYAAGSIIGTLLYLENFRHKIIKANKDRR